MRLLPLLVCAVLLVGFALIYGFTARLPPIPRWLWLRPVRGSVIVCLGVAALFVPTELIVSAYLIGVGVRMVWSSACVTPPAESASREIVLSRGQQAPDGYIEVSRVGPPGIR